MTDIEIDKALALAIGWKDEPNKMRVSDVWGLQVWIDYWANFSHKDWYVIGPIAERYMLVVDFGINSVEVERFTYVYADTPQKAIALAVIEGANK